jgi:hypothetical protein
MTIPMRVWTRTAVDFEPLERFRNRNVQVNLFQAIGRAISDKFRRIKVSANKFFASIGDLFRTKRSRRHRQYNETLETVDHKLNSMVDKLATQRIGGREVFHTLQSIQGLSGRMDELFQRCTDRGELLFGPGDHQDMARLRMEKLVDRLARTNPRTLQSLKLVFHPLTNWRRIEQEMRQGFIEQYEQLNAVMDMLGEPEIPIPNPDTDPRFQKAMADLTALRDVVDQYEVE